MLGFVGTVALAHVMSRAATWWNRGGEMGALLSGAPPFAVMFGAFFCWSVPSA
ncbi:MAG: hypothetical protein R3E94_07235 [Burkholderiaceae bacterium]